jgi:hypothetical protein
MSMTFVGVPYSKSNHDLFCELMLLNPPQLMHPSLKNDHNIIVKSFVNTLPGLVKCR